MRFRLVLSTALAAFLAVMSVGGTRAGAPPPPPPTPICTWCLGPPPAPTPVPTLAPTVVAPVMTAVSVEVSPVHVKRGQSAKVQVSASKAAKVTIMVRYHSGKPATYRATTDGAGKLVKTWRVPKSAPLGKARVQIDVAGEGKPYSTTVSITVVK